jgi:hypothetical protein
MTLSSLKPDNKKLSPLKPAKEALLIKHYESLKADDQVDKTENYNDEGFDITRQPEDYQKCVFSNALSEAVDRMFQIPFSPCKMLKASISSVHNEMYIKRVMGNIGSHTGIHRHVFNRNISVEINYVFKWTLSLPNRAGHVRFTAYEYLYIGK